VSEWRASSPPPEASPDLRARILEAARSEPVPTRAMGARRRATVVAAGFALTAAVFVAISLPNLRGRPFSYVVALIVAWVPIAALATWAGVGQGRSMLGRAPMWQLATAVLTPEILMLSWIAVATRWPETLVDSSRALHHVRCIVVTLGFAVGPFVAFAFLRRRSDPLRPRLTGAAIGTAAGAWGAAILPLICGFTAPRHMLLGHLLPVVLMAALGLALGERLVAVRAKTE
jgi:hypothetical protein